MSFDTTRLSTEDEGLINGLRHNSNIARKAEEQLFTRYMYFIREGMSKYSLTEEDSFDAYADAVLEAINNIIDRVFEGRSSLKTYLYRIFSNKCVDVIRKKTTNKSSVHQTAAISDMLYMIADPAKSAVQRLIDASNIAVLRDKLVELGDKCREILGMFADDYTDREIAELMNYKSPDVVKTSRLRCLEKLRQLYKI